MKILISSVRFAPAIGGIETVTQILAEQFMAAGHEVVVLTQSPGGPLESPYRVERNVSVWRVFRWAHWCDVYLQNNISLRFLWPAVLSRWRSILIVHQTWIARNDGSISAIDRIKRGFARVLPGVVISQAIQRQINPKLEVIGNPYDAACFRILPGSTRPKQLVFLGRLVSDKGCDLLLQAMAELKREGIIVNATIVGIGPEEEALRSLVRRLDLGEQVDFVGAKTGQELVELLNGHQVMVVPSLWNEPFGIVVLEGIACGCVVIASEGGGVPEAIGPCGLTFPNGDATALKTAIKRILQDPSLADGLRAHREAHLEQFSPATIAGKYLKMFQAAAQR